MSDKIGMILVTKKIITESQLVEALSRKEKEPDKYLGQILCEMGLPQARIIKAIYYRNKRKQLGQILVDLKIITPDQLNNVLLNQRNLRNKKVHMPLGKLLAEQGARRLGVRLLGLPDYETRIMFCPLSGPEHEAAYHRCQEPPAMAAGLNSWRLRKIRGGSSPS